MKKNKKRPKGIRRKVYAKKTSKKASKKRSAKKTSKKRAKKKVKRRSVARVKSRPLSFLRRRMGSYAAISRVIGVSPSTVARWARDGLPKDSPHLQLLQELWTAESKVATAEETDRKNFELLRELAGEEQMMPEFRTHDGRFSGSHIAGYEWAKRFNRELDPRLVEEIARWLRGVRPSSVPNLPRYTWWHAVAIVSQYALRNANWVDSGLHTIKQFRSPDLTGKLGEFVPNDSIGARKSDRKDLAIADLIRRLQLATEESNLRVFVHGVFIKYYRIKDHDEQLAYAAKKKHQRDRKEVRETKSKKARRKKKRTRGAVRAVPRKHR